MASEGVVLSMDWDISKAEAKQRKLNRDMDISVQKAENIKNKIEELNVSLEDEKNKQKEIRNQIAAQTKEAAMLERQIEKIKSGNATTQEIINLGNLDAAEAKLKEMNASIKKKEEAYDKSRKASKKLTAEIASQNLALRKQNATTANIGDKIAANSQKQKEFGKATESAETPLARFGKRIKELIKSALKELSRQV